jgi:serine/threonine protein kinase
MTLGLMIKAGAVVGGTYRVLERIGAGGMGEVWRAEHVRLPGLSVAIKFLFVEQVSPEGLERFEREGVVMAGLNHPHITRVFDFNTTPEGIPYIVLELLEGEPLSARLERGPLELDELCHVLSQTASALQATHSKGIIHRDLKPDNIFLHRVPDQPAPMVKVLDFGVSKVRGVQKITMHQRGFLGTPHYMSPEQALGREDVTPAADQFSLAIIVYEMLSGRLPFDGEQVIQIATQVVQAPAPPIQGLVPSLPNAAASALHKALSKAPGDRFESCKAFAVALIDGLTDDDDWSNEARTEVIADSRAALDVEANYTPLSGLDSEDVTQGMSLFRQNATLQMQAIDLEAYARFAQDGTAPDLPARADMPTQALPPLITKVITPADFFPIAQPAPVTQALDPYSARLGEGDQTHISVHAHPTVALGLGSDFPTADPLEPDPPRGGGVFARVLLGLIATAVAVGAMWTLRPQAPLPSAQDLLERINESAVVTPPSIEAPFKGLALRASLSQRAYSVEITSEDLTGGRGELRVTAPVTLFALIEVNEQALSEALGEEGELVAQAVGPGERSRDVPLTALKHLTLSGGLGAYAAPLSFGGSDEGRWTVGLLLRPEREAARLIATLPLRVLGPEAPTPSQPPRRGR